ncbi:MAG TPA: hypothetical protein VK803_06340 [Steroidobacteraceae bacterium]|jgi:hypothetical protein|nr:hypothetical protein [Steroidobacteraceae bacterium]
MSTTWEQLEGAALALARSGNIKDRLADAYRHHLALVEADALPDALRAQFRACHAALTREPPLRGEDAVRATVRKMSNVEADEIAVSVVRLFAAMAHAAAHETRAELSEQLLNGGVVGARGKLLKAVPQAIALFAAEA